MPADQLDYELCILFRNNERKRANVPPPSDAAEEKALSNAILNSQFNLNDKETQQ